MKTCLVVDDSKVIRTVARRILEELAFEITEAEDGRQALAACDASVPDLVLLDWNMPVMDGLEFLKALRAREGIAQPVIVFCTTENDMSHIRVAMEAGANEYIMKPFDREIMEAKLSQVGLL
ncbi:two-component system chemotaxis response regulator CheY [Rhodothalassium salexigens DSM 2132]|uniref:Two-component system chemotaxis response regulator CheY n=1 Tax=Rhodothalassium salexigens DSM 2132 TaxID=1188247 RepID=A0A4R2PGH3_RHOSA|nr:response regulator [Rhodothalassium salexigens]MBB4211616.1 two-component system chemotaxis response regulator CheY [Rhodothalassium salexigens DSM 2132]MBK1639567.1 two-component system response regulator [Rhodothalassium salexigens DSM 2132]TCP34452.1 two-component system chemotaxis response regulator CheY [Rhodothalassium salexigens DSM 2132]